MKRCWYRAELPYAVFGVAVREGIVVETAPIARWMVGKKLTEVSAWIRNKGGEISELRRTRRRTRA